MIYLKEILERLSGVHALNQRVEMLIKQTANFSDLFIKHEHRITRLETIQEIKNLELLAKL